MPSSVVGPSCGLGFRAFDVDVLVVLSSEPLLIRRQIPFHLGQDQIAPMHFLVAVSFVLFFVSFQ